MGRADTRQLQTVKDAPLYKKRKVYQKVLYFCSYEQYFERFKILIVSQVDKINRRSENKFKRRSSFNFRRISWSRQIFLHYATKFLLAELKQFLRKF